jgi:hypothetical protein
MMLSPLKPSIPEASGLSCHFLPYELGRFTDARETFAEGAAAPREDHLSIDGDVEHAVVSLDELDLGVTEVGFHLRFHPGSLGEKVSRNAVEDLYFHDSPHYMIMTPFFMMIRDRPFASLTSIVGRFTSPSR